MNQKMRFIMHTDYRRMKTKTAKSRGIYDEKGNVM